MSKTYIIDGNSLLFRSFYATFRPGVPVMCSSSGVPTNAIFSYQNMMSKIKAQLKTGDRMIVCFDTGKKTFRAAKLESYKMNRKPIEPALKAQLSLAREMLTHMGILYCELEGYEGDDLAGSLAKYASSQGDEVSLFTSDKDFLQLLVYDNVTVRFLRKGLSEIEIFTKENVHEKMGYQADQVIDYKGLVGDPSDNIPGIKGVGEKTALKLLDTYPHLEEIFEGIKDEKSKTMLNIIEHSDVAYFCREMATIITDLDVQVYYQNGLLKGANVDDLLDFYKRYDLKKAYQELLNIENSKMSLFGGEEKEEEEIIFDGAKTIASFKELSFKPRSIIAYNSSTNFHEGEVLGFYFSDGKFVEYLPYDKNVIDEDFVSYLASNEEKSTYDLKGLIVSLEKIGVLDINNVSFDLQLATYVLHQDVKQDKVSCLNFYHRDISTYSLENQHAYLCLTIPQVQQEVIESLKKDEEYELYSQIELPLNTVLAKMEIEGFPIDKDELEIINIDYQNKLNSITEQINQMVGHPINLNSPKQVGELIYDELQLKKKGKINSTSIEVLSKLVDIHPVIPLIIMYRKYQKLVSSYTSSLSRYIQDDGKIHAIFNQALTNTGRLSMSEPNLQNISIRDEEGKEIRKAFFYPHHEYEFLSLDYSQVELRVLASVANLDEMIEVFNSDIDIHTSTASKIFHVPLEDVTSLMRRKAKAVNFGIVYGISSWGLAEQIKVPPYEAQQIIKAFYDSYPGLKEFEDNVIAFAKSNGYVKTILNRRRYIDEINDMNRNSAEFGQRAAVNTVIQGSAADLIKVAMIDIDKMLQSYKTKMVLQIHDELIFKVPKDEKDIIETKIKDIMEHAIEMKCALKAEGSFGLSWYECK